MKKITDYAVLSEAISHHFGKTTVTNCFIDRQSYDAEIAAGTLFIHEYDGGLYIIKQRDGFAILYFYLDSPASVIDQIPENSVIEIPYRERDEGLKSVAERFADSGTTKLFSRVRLTKIAEPTEYSDEHISVANEDDSDEIAGLLYKSFDRLTGCLPSRDVLDEDIHNGNILVYRDGGKVVGLLQLKNDKATTEIRHLAVDENYRGQGIASSLVKSYLSDKKGRARVWVREDYTDARRVYENNGYEPDGMKSTVLIKQSEVK